MQVTASQSTAHAMTPRLAGRADVVSNFKHDLSRVGGSSSTPLRKASEQLVAHALIMPMLKSMQNDPFQTDLFHGGQAEKTFAAQLHEILAERMTRKSNFPLIDAIERRFMPGRVDTHG